MDRLKGEVAIVTGASRGIGRAVALCFAREGARVAITAVADRDALEQVQREIAAAGADVLATIADVARRADVDGLVQGIVAKWGRIDILVNNAGILRIAPLETISEERWDETLAVHLKGTFNCTQAVIPFMKQQRKGKIINL
ncbi:MAG: SDR family NAD(P)-dependent oxidoreductase, partial [Candidatus Binatia bacterium]